MAGGPDRLIGQPDESFVAHLAVVVAADPEDLRRRCAEAGVTTATHYPVPDYRQPAWAWAWAGAGAGSEPLALPVTEALVRGAVSLPCFPELRDDEVARVCDVLAARG